MPVLISMLRGVNLGAHNRIKMEALRAMYESLKLEDPRTYVQSGNVIFRTKQNNTATLATRIQDAVEKTFQCRPEVILRTPDELRQAALDRLKSYPEELHLIGRELHVYFPNGIGKSKLPWSSIEKLLKVTGTARNWNSVQAILQIAEEMEAAK